MVPRPLQKLAGDPSLCLHMSFIHMLMHNAIGAELSQGK